MHAEIYNKLRQHCHQHPIGFPGTESGIELDILERLFTKEEAAIALSITPYPDTAQGLAQKLGRNAEELGSLLERMADKGLILRTGERGKGRFRMIPYMPGIYEFQLKAMDRALAEEFAAYYPELGKELFSSPTPFTRVLPMEKHLPGEIEVFPYERASELVREARRVALAECICRKERKLSGAGCDRPRDETCLVFSPMAEQYLEHDLAREASLDEALGALERGERAGLVRTALNVRTRTTFICQCCPCCCGLLRGLTELDIPTAVARSYFTPTIDVESCTGCEACLEICPMKALTMRDAKAVVNLVKGIGCGLCVSECPADSISLQRKAREEIVEPPANFVELMTAIAREKGRTYFYP